jgi:membrane dipeptidase
MAAGMARSELDCGIACIASWKNVTEVMAAIGKWHRLLENNRDLVAAAMLPAEIERIATSGRTAIVFGFNSAARSSTTLIYSPRSAIRASTPCS